MTGGLFASAPVHPPADPLERVFAYLDFLKEMLRADPTGCASSLAAIEGTFVLAKAKHKGEMAAAFIDQLHRHIELFFNQTE